MGLNEKYISKANPTEEELGDFINKLLFHKSNDECCGCGPREERTVIRVSFEEGDCLIENVFFKQASGCWELNHVNCGKLPVAN